MASKEVKLKGWENQWGLDTAPASVAAPRLSFTLG
jgi:hypothetical protein